MDTYRKAITHIAGPLRIYAALGYADNANLEVKSIRPPHLSHTLTASISRERLFLAGGVPGAEYEVVTADGPFSIRVVEGGSTFKGGNAGGGKTDAVFSGGQAAAFAYFDVPPVVTLIDWRPGSYVLQSPASRRPRGFDYTRHLAELGPDVRIVESSWKASEGLSYAADVHDGFRAIAWSFGGLDGEDYALTNHVTFSDGTEDERTVEVRIRKQ